MLLSARGQAQNIGIGRRDQRRRRMVGLDPRVGQDVAAFFARSELAIAQHQLESRSSSFAKASAGDAATSTRVSAGLQNSLQGQPGARSPCTNSTGQDPPSAGFHRGSECGMRAIYPMLTVHFLFSATRIRPQAFPTARK